MTRAKPTAGKKRAKPTAGKKRAKPTAGRGTCECQRPLALESQNRRKEKHIDPVIEYTYTLRGTSG